LGVKTRFDSQERDRWRSLAENQGKAAGRALGVAPRNKRGRGKKRGARLPVEAD